MEILVTIGYIVLCVLVFSVAIAIHELGHFLVALKLGFKVERFSIGFGPALWRKTWKGVEYRISAIPLGGYVMIPELDPECTKALEGSGAKEAGDRESGETGRRVAASPLKELAVAFAGPAMNIVLAVVLAVALSFAPGAKFGVLPPRIGSVVEDGPAAKAGLSAGDIVLAVGGRPIETWSDLTIEVQIVGEKPAVFTVERGGETIEVEVTPERDAVTGACFIKALSEPSASQAASWMPSRNPLKQLAWDAGSIFRVLKGLATPKDAKATSKALGGPVLIAESIYGSMRRNIFDGLGFMRYLNVNLAVLNLLPIPVLDGGLIMFSLFAIVFRRRVPECVVKYSSIVFMVLLLGLMGLLICRDSMRSYRMHTHVYETANESAEGR